MIKTRARVLSVSGGKVWIEAASQQGCAACHSQSSCGVSGLGKFFSRNKPPVALACDLSVRPGEELVLDMSEADLLRAGRRARLFTRAPHRDYPLARIAGSPLSDHPHQGDFP
jgi:sigma-E factor negative regulatory protein RseC